MRTLIARLRQRWAEWAWDRHVGRSRRRDWKAAARYLERRYPEKYGKKGSA